MGSITERDRAVKLEDQTYSKIWKADDRTEEFFARIHLGGKHAFFQAYMADDTKRSEWREVKHGVVLPIDFVEKADALFFGVNTVSARVTPADREKYPGEPDKQIEKWVGTKNETVDVSNCVISEFDAKDEPDVTDEEVEAIFVVMRADTENKTKDAVLRRQAIKKAKAIKFATDPDKYMAMARARVAALPLKPSAVLNSGGGFHVYHYFRHTFKITCEADFKRLQSLYARWVKLIGADPASKDVRRLLRVPGRPNKKPAYAPNYPIVTFESYDPEVDYLVEDFEALFPPEEPPKEQPKRVGGFVATGTGGNTDKPLDIFNRENKIEDILLDRGYTWFGRDRMSRPYEPDSGGVEIDRNTNMSRHWSGNDECCDEHWQRPSNIVVRIDYDGDLERAVKEIGAAQRKAKATSELAERRSRMDAKKKQNNTKAAAVASPIVEIAPAGPFFEDPFDHASSFAPVDVEIEENPFHVEAIPDNGNTTPNGATTTTNHDTTETTTEAPATPAVTLPAILEALDALPDTDRDGNPSKDVKKFATMDYLLDHALDCAKLPFFDGGKLGVELQRRGVPLTFINKEFAKAKEKALEAEAAAAEALQAEAEEAKRKLKAQEKALNPYSVHNGCIGEWNTYKNKETGEESEIFDPFCNFDAYIVADVQADDGEEVRRKIVLAGRLMDGSDLPEVEIEAEEFEPMKWPVAKWGARVSIEPEKGYVYKLRHAIQKLTGDAMEDRRTFTHTGWRMVDGQRVYLHAGGAVGADGDIEASVQLDGNLKYYRLPTDDKVAIKEAMRASVDLLDLGPSKVTCPLWAITWAAPLSEIITPSFMPTVVGPSGAGKTSTVALYLNHFGKDFNENRMPSDFTGTANKIEHDAFCAKDALMVVDDLRPSTSMKEHQTLMESVSRLARAAGNRIGRGRLDSNAKARRAYDPRGLAMITAERGAVGESTNSRMLYIPLGKGDIDFKLLTAAQKKRHMLAYAMRGFLRSVAKDWDTLKEALPERVLDIRGENSDSGHHKRLPNVTAILTTAFEAAMSFALEVGAVDEAEAARRITDCVEALRVLEEEQSAKTEEEDPATKYVNTLATLIAQNRAYLGGKTLKSGAKIEPIGAIETEKLGWYDGQNVFLLSSAYNTVYKYMQAEGLIFPISEIELRQKLRDKGWMGKTTAGRNELSVAHPDTGKTLRVTTLDYQKFAALLLELNVDFKISGMETNGGAL